VGAGASTNLVLHDTLTEADTYIIEDNGYVQYFHNNEWIPLNPGQSRTETYTTDSYEGFTGNLVVTETITNFGIREKSNIVSPDLTPTPENPGDVNGDGVIDIIDALLTARYSVGLNPEGFNVDQGDANCDGSINIVDALLFAQYFVGLITEFC